MADPSLARRSCVPCHGGTPKLDAARVAELARELPGWRVEGDKLVKRFAFADFVAAMRFLQRVADVAEAEQHHPDFCVRYDKVDFSIWTHAVGGLSDNDFILAAKIDELAG
jgi:4a-hydroxytetrahydrobiopterin dehydratase